MNQNLLCLRRRRCPGWILFFASLAFGGAIYAEDNTRVEIIGYLTNTGGGSFTVGSTGTNNTMIISNGGVLINGVGYVGSTASASNNWAVVTGEGSIWTNTSTFNIGAAGSFNQLTITSTGKLVTTGSAYVGGVSGGRNNTLVVSDGGTWDARGAEQGMGVANGGHANQMIITNGGKVANNAAFYIGYIAGANGQSVLVSGSGSVWSNYSGITYVGYNTSSNQLTINDGGLYVGYLWVGSAAGVSGNVVNVTSGGTIEIPSGASMRIAANTGGAITNSGGVFQFTRATPSITTNTGIILLTNGVISFRAIADAPLTAVDQITYQGDNGFQLNAATNAAGLSSYTFDTGLGAENYQRLILVGANPQWRSGRLNVGSGGELLITNATGAAVDAALTNLGSVRVINSTVTWQSNVVIGGRYHSDPSTNVFATNVTVTASGSLYGSNGDLFVFQKDFINQSTNASEFNLAHAAVLFSNAATHVMSLSNSGSMNLGVGWTNFAQVATNFAIGQLSIAVGNQVVISGNKDSRTNALYVGWLDIQGSFDTNSYTEVTNALASALKLPDIDVYYDKYDARNDWLNANLINDSASGYNLWGGGLLLPIPEPSTLGAIGLGAVLMLAMSRRRR